MKLDEAKNVDDAGHRRGFLTKYSGKFINQNGQLFFYCSLTMEPLFFSIIFTIAGLYFLFRNLSMIRNDEKIKKYLEASWQGRLWISKLGLEKTLNLTKRIFLPLGIAVSVLFIGCGVYMLMGLL